MSLNHILGHKTRSVSGHVTGIELSGRVFAYMFARSPTQRRSAIAVGSEPLSPDDRKFMRHARAPVALRALQCAEHDHSSTPPRHASFEPSHANVTESTSPAAEAAWVLAAATQRAE